VAEAVSDPPRLLPDVQTLVTEEPPPLDSDRVERDRTRAKHGEAAVRHAARFQFFTGALVFFAVASMALAFVFAATSGERTSSESSWASFKPSSDGLDTGAREIAEYVGRQYRLPAGEQIVAVEGGPMEFLVQDQKLPMKIAVRQSVADGGDISILDGKGVLYRMCGLGVKCSISAGKPTQERALLLRREALELALYSFHDLKSVDHVVVFMPPAKGEDPSIALHFGRGDVAGQLARPLRATLPTPVPNPDTIATAPNTTAVQQLTFANLFKFSLTTGNQDASVFLVLDPLPTDS
jgi:hypothetical protein